MNLQQRINILVELGDYLAANGDAWQTAKSRAFIENGWFTAEFVDLATQNIVAQFLQRDKLETWVNKYGLPDENPEPKTVGLVMAGNIPLVGFHDLLCCFITGHCTLVKTSSKDDVLIKHLVQKMYAFEVTVQNYISFAPLLKNCDAYIATGSNNTSRYFEYYFGKYPSIIRKNRTSAAVLDGNETQEELALLADDMMLYFGLGCRNVTKLYVPENYNFEPLIKALAKYNYLADHNKLKNNFDYNLSLHILNNKYFMSSGSILLVEHPSLFSAISQVHYEFYTGKHAVAAILQASEEVQAIVGHGFMPFGSAQVPTLPDYADGVDTMQFLKDIR